MVSSIAAKLRSRWVLGIGFWVLGFVSPSPLLPFSPSVISRRMVYVHKPLTRCPEEQRAVAAPAVRVAVVDFGQAHQVAGLFERLNHPLAHRRPISLPSELLPGLECECARLVDWAEHLKPVSLPSLKVLFPMPRRGMDYPGPVLHGHVVSKNDWRGAVKKRVPPNQPLKLAAPQFARRASKHVIAPAVIL